MTTTTLRVDGPDGLIEIVIDVAKGHVTVQNASRVTALHQAVARGPIINFRPRLGMDHPNATMAGVIDFRTHDVEARIQRNEPVEADHLLWPRLVAFNDGGSFCIRAGNAVSSNPHNHWTLHCEPIG